MQKANVNDEDYTSGVVYETNIFLDVGEHSYYFIASDGFDSTNLPAIGVFAGPAVSKTGFENWVLLITIIVGSIVGVSIGILSAKKKRKNKRGEKNQ
ncbi:MAG: hypothetical protein ACTSUE_24045 [Promethearchaeota archaeon]